MLCARRAGSGSGTDVGNLAVGHLFYRSVPAECVADHLTFAVQSRPRARFFTFQVNMYIDKARNRVAERVLEAAEDYDLSHVLLVDQDMHLPLDLPEQLLALDAPIASALYCRTVAPYDLVAFKLVPGGCVYYDREELDMEGLNKVDGVGLGACLIHLDVLKDLKSDWFRSAGGSGEDVYFFQRVRDELGVPVLLDCRARVGHVGDIRVMP